MENHTEATEESISEQLKELWGQLTRNQRRFVAVAQDHTTKAAAAVAVGLEPDTVYRWPDIVNEAIDLFSADITIAALNIVLANAGKAAMVKVEALDDADVRVRQAAATEILDRALGKPKHEQKAIEVIGVGGGPIGIEITEVVVEMPPEDDYEATY